MADPSLTEVMDAMAEQISDELGSVVDDLQVVGRMNVNPTVPSIDIYPSDPFQEQISFGKPRGTKVFFDVRARVTTADHEGGQDLLLSMMDPRADESVAAALESDGTLSGKASDVSVEPPSNYGLYVDPGQTEGYLGCVWRVEVIL